MGKRLFVALTLPDEMAGRLAGLDPGVDGLRWTPAERLHLTLCFLGSVGEAAGRRLLPLLARIECCPFPLRVKGIGCFAKRGGLVVWAGIDDPRAAVAALHRQVAAAVREAGLDPGPPGLRPHVTLARARRGKPAMIRGFLAAHAGEPFGGFTVAGFSLFSSIPGPEGPSYHEEYRRNFSSLPG
jgi:2'-5' RNA ligase